MIAILHAIARQSMRETLALRNTHDAIRCDPTEQPAPAPRVAESKTRPPAAMRAPRSAAERWLLYVLKACEADTDLKTLESWAQHAAVSYTTLCANCRIMGIRPLDARNFTRVLRALRRASSQICPPQVFLDVSDVRTVRALSAQAGIDLESEADSSSIADFFARQQFVDGNNQGLQLIRNAVVG
jgi:hypothetical protein